MTNPESAHFVIRHSGFVIYRLPTKYSCAIRKTLSNLIAHPNKKAPLLVSKKRGELLATSYFRTT
jgi:hypothetical protein